MINTSFWQLLNVIDALMGLHLLFDLDLSIIPVIYIIKTLIYIFLTIPYLKSIVGVLTILDFIIVFVYILDIDYLFRFFGIYLLFKVFSTMF